MKSLYSYIKESSQSNKDKFLQCAEDMFAWWQDNIGDYYDHEHGRNPSNLKDCDLIKKKVKCDCAGFVGAVLCFAGYTDDPVNWSVKFGSFNLDKHINNKRDDEDEKNLHIQYMKDVKDSTDGWHVYKLASIDRWPEAKPGDILYSSGHIAILGKDRNLLHCSEKGNDDRHFRAYWRLEN